MKIVSIDIAYAKPIPICVLSERGKLVCIQEIKNANDIYTTSKLVLEAVIPFGPCLVISETPLLIHNMNTAFMMARMHAMLEKGVRDSGSLFFGIHPATWQKQMLNPQKGDDRKKLSVALAAEWLGRADITHDIADAINLARFAFDNKKEILKAMRGGKKFSEK